MEKINFTLPTIAAFLLCMGGQVKMNFTAEELSLSNTEKKGEKEVLPPSTTKKILIAYFSHSGNTREIANQIHKIVGGDIFEIQPITDYPDDYQTVVDQAKKEINSDFKPALKTTIKNIDAYDVIIIGSPNWWSTIAPPVATFLSSYNLSGKTIVPFITHGGGGMGHCVSEIKKLCSKSSVLKGLPIRDIEVKRAHDDVIKWLREIKITK